MTTYTGNDAENFSPAMLGADVILGYLGGPYAAGKAWSDASWAACGTKPKIGIWVPKPNATYTDARDEILPLLNWALHFHWGRGQPVAFDLETSQADYSYMSAMGGFLQFFNDYGTVGYHTLDGISAAMPPYLWRWSASWTDPRTPHLDPGMHATQWTDGPAFDQSVITQELYSRIVWR